MAKFKASVMIDVEIELDETKFDEAFMAEFRQSFYPFYDINDHVEHLAQLQARGLLDFFTEGYGEIKDMGIDGRELDVNVESIERLPMQGGSNG
jgi:hypothetical protein